MKRWWLPSGFLAVAALLATRHELWRDETQAWLLARDSRSWSELVQNGAYEGHPLLWHLALKVVQLFGDSVYLMQGLAVVIGAATVWIVASYAPFTRWQQIALAGGYFVLFEYTIVARAYGLGVMFALAFCALYARRADHTVALGVALFLLSQTSVYGVIIAACTIPLIADRRHWLGVGVALAGLVVAVMQLLPPTDSGYAVPWYFTWDARRLDHALQALFNAYVPISASSERSWNSNAFAASGFLPVIWVLLVAFLGALVHTLARTPRALAFFVAATVAQLAFVYVKFEGNFRHHGHLFVVALMALWLARIEESERSSETVSELTPGRLLRIATPAHLLTVLLVVQIAGAARIVPADWTRPFSNARAAAAFIAERGEQLPLVAYRDAAATTVLAYTRGGSAYYLQGERIGSFARWDSIRVAALDAAAITCGALARSRSVGGPVLLLTNQFPGAERSDSSFVRLAEFDGAMAPNENFWITRVDASRTRADIGC